MYIVSIILRAKKKKKRTKGNKTPVKELLPTAISNVCNK